MSYAHLLFLIFTSVLWSSEIATVRPAATMAEEPPSPTAPAETIETADLWLPVVIGDNMVLQSDMPVPIWGRAQAGRRVTVCFAGQTKRTIAAVDGRWMIELDALAGE